jgi:hypothetical protein
VIRFRYVGNHRLVVHFTTSYAIQFARATFEQNVLETIWV